MQQQLWINRRLETIARGRGRFRPFWAVPIVAMVFCWLAAGVLLAADDDDDENPLPEPQETDLKTADGLNMKITYYPGTKQKATVPVLILHDAKGSREDYRELAIYLQEKGHAVVVPDLRGHGASTKWAADSRRTKPPNAKNLKPRDLENMIRFDLETIKRFLVERNNVGELNIEKLCVVGSGMGAIVAAHWAIKDWNWPVLPTFKQGRHVKALILVSPEWVYRKLSIKRPIENRIVQPELSVLILVGNEKEASQKNADKIFRILGKHHEDPDPKEPKKQTLFLRELKTSLQGAKMVSQSELKARQIIAGFIELRLVDQSFPWAENRRP